MVWCLMIGCMSVVWFATSVSAHTMKTVYLEITEIQRGKAIVFRKATVNDDSVRVVFPTHCRVDMRWIERVPPMRRYEMVCREGLQGQSLSFEGLGQVISEVVVRVQLHGGKTVSTVLHAQRNHWIIPGEHRWNEVFLSYVGMGLTHIWKGADHLLFLLALLLLISRPGAMFWTVTAFTCSHSLTLGLTALGWLHLSHAVAETCIAWSLVLAAWDVTRKTQATQTEHAGIAMGFVFGLVHGLGFAGSLLSIGLPEHAIAASLLGFNVGVELGQLLIVIPGFWMIADFRRVWSERWLDNVGAYAVGTLGAYWLWQRLAALFYSG